MNVIDPRILSAVGLGLAIIGVTTESRKMNLASKKSKERGIVHARFNRAPDTVTPPSPFVFFLGVLNVIFQVFLVSAMPWNYFLYHTAKATVYLFIRARDFRNTKEIWFITEFCYIVNFLTVAYVVVCLAKKFVPALAFLKPLLDPYGPILFRIAFTWSLGPVALSVATFKNAMVFHSMRHMVILAVHLGPPILVWCFRFYHAEIEQHWPDTFHLDIDPQNETLTETLHSLLVMPAIAYFVLWLIPYSLLQYVVKHEEIQREHQRTMLDDIPGLNDLPEPERPMCYCKVHASASFIAFVAAQLWWRSHALTTVFLLSLLASSVWNGATFYFKAMGMTTSKKPLEKEKEKEEEKAAAAAADPAPSGVEDKDMRLQQ